MFNKKNTSEVQDQSLEERIRALETDIFHLEKKYTDAESTALSSFRQLKKEDELQSISAEIGAKRKEINNLRLDSMRAVRNEIVQKAEALADEKRGLLKRIRKIDQEGQKLKGIFEKNIPHRRLQVSASQSVRMEKEIFETRRNMGIKGTTTYEKIPRRAEELVAAVPSKVKRFQAEGWKLCPGEKIDEWEPLDNDNSIEILGGIPDVFGEFDLIIGLKGEEIVGSVLL